MNDVFGSIGAEKSMPAPNAETLYRTSANSEWQSSGHPGFLVKPLFEANGRRTLLMRVEPGAFSEKHGHEETEEVFVLSGTFYDQDRTYHSGDYLIRSPGFLHEAGSKDGAELLLIYW